MLAKIEFAPDGQHYQTIKEAKTAIKLWDFFCFTQDIHQQLRCNPFAKFRLVSENGKIIGELSQ